MDADDLTQRLAVAGSGDLAALQRFHSTAEPDLDVTDPRVHRALFPVDRTGGLVAVFSHRNRINSDGSRHASKPHWTREVDCEVSRLHLLSESRIAVTQLGGSSPGSLDIFNTGNCVFLIKQLMHSVRDITTVIVCSSQ